MIFAYRIGRCKLLLTRQLQHRNWGGGGLRALLKGSLTVVDARYSFTFPTARFLPMPVWGFEPRTQACLSFRLYCRKAMCFNYTWIFYVTVIEFKLENLAFPLGRLPHSKAYVTLHNCDKQRSEIQTHKRH